MMKKTLKDYEEELETIYKALCVSLGLNDCGTRLDGNFHAIVYGSMVSVMCRVLLAPVITAMAVPAEK